MEVHIDVYGDKVRLYMNDYNFIFERYVSLNDYNRMLKTVKEMEGYIDDCTDEELLLLFSYIRDVLEDRLA